MTITETACPVLSPNLVNTQKFTQGTIMQSMKIDTYIFNENFISCQL